MPRIVILHFDLFRLVLTFLFFLVPSGLEFHELPIGLQRGRNFGYGERQYPSAKLQVGL